MLEKLFPQRPGGAGRSLTIRRKILLAFLAMAAITAAFGWSAVRSIRVTGALVVEAFDRSLMSVNHARAAQAGFTGLRSDLADALDASDQTPPAVIEQFASAGDSVLEDLVLARGRVLSVESVAAIDRTTLAVTSWVERAQAIMRAPRTTPTVAPEVTAVIAEFELLINFVAGDAFRGRQQSLATIARQRSIAIGAVVLALIMSALIAAMLARRLVTSVASASAVAGHIAEGQLDVQIPPGGTDELGQLMRSMAAMRDNIQAMVERERAQRRSAQTRLVDAIEGSREGVVLVDADGAILLANSQARAFLPGLIPAFVPGTSYEALLAAARAPKAICSPTPRSSRSRAPRRRSSPMAAGCGSRAARSPRAASSRSGRRSPCSRNARPCCARRAIAPRRRAARRPSSSPI